MVSEATHASALHLLVHGAHDVVWGFEVLHDAVLEGLLLSVGQLVAVVLGAEGLLLAD